MSATMTAPEQVDGLEKLLQLASLNKDTIAAAAEEGRRQIQLTQAEEGRIAEAKSWIAKHGQLSADLEARENALASAASVHAASKEDFAQHVASENQRLEAFAASLTARESAVSIAEKRNESETQALSAMRLTYNREHEEAMGVVRAAEAANIAVGQALTTEKQRLADWEASLKAKAQRIKTEAASL